MLPLLLTLLLTSPTPKPPPEPQHCTVRCRELQYNNWYGWVCWYREQPACDPTQWICVESPGVICRDSIERLGAWDPVTLPKR